ncbi:MAG TPA: hypothetical protein VHW66_23900 [Stellaceae bacterium]|nr:hypothetical protein [Stellaceae bacterium]
MLVIDFHDAQIEVELPVEVPVQGILRCYAERKQGRWQAFCVDFDLAVQGDSFEEVYASLDQAVGEYRNYVSELPEPDRSRLLRRRAPIGSRVAFLSAVVRTALRSREDHDEGSFGYTLPYAA